jgi:ribonuclease III
LVVSKKFIDEEKTKQTFQSLNDKLGVISKNIPLYILAFIHRSIVNERPDKAPEHNERLEFLGDAVLELVVTEKLFLDFPEKSE